MLPYKTVTDLCVHVSCFVGSDPPNAASHFRPHVYVHTSPKISGTCHNKQDDYKNVVEIEQRII